MAHLPLVNRSDDTVAHAIVDDADLAALSAYRWYFNGEYAARGEGGRVVYLHRHILGLERGDPRQGDHINQDKLDNRRANLRAVTKAENSQNLSVRCQRTKTSRFRGVSRTASGKWEVICTLDGRLHRLGRFATEEEAAAVAAAWRAEHMPFSPEAAERSVA